jgi:hypothetical protein
VTIARIYGGNEKKSKTGKMSLGWRLYHLEESRIIKPHLWIVYTVAGGLIDHGKSFFVILLPHYFT